MATKFRPNDFAEFWPFANKAVVAEPISLRLFSHFQTGRVIGRRAGLAAEQRSSLRTGEAIGDIDVSVSFDAFHGFEVIRTEDVVSPQRNMTGRDAKVSGVVCGRTLDATEQPAGFGPVTFRVFDPTLETRVLRALERLFPIQVGAAELLRVSKARFVIEFAAGVDRTPFGVVRR